MTIDEDHNVVRYMQLFRCNERSYGTWHPKNAALTEGRSNTVKGQPIPREAYRSHLEGHVGIGGVPIMDDNNCWWAAIDIDTHGPKGRDFDIFQMESAIQKFKYPLIVCKSKSGGAHLYVFFKRPTPAAIVRPQLARWAKALGWPEAEIFPKQSNLDSPLGERDKPLGNWINLPYFKINGGNRFCIHGGREVAFEYFLELAEGARYEIPTGDAATSDEYAAGPPCVQEMIRTQVDEGGRNTAIFQVSVFLKRARPEDWKERVREFNSLALGTPLNNKELRQIIGSVNRKDYNYKCREEPCKSLCNRELCRTREFGISDDDAKANELPPFDKVEKVIATPIRWVLHIQQQQIELTSAELFDYGRVRQAVYEKLNLLLPRMKNEEWDVHLREVAAKAETRHETTLEDVMFIRLCDFLRRSSRSDRTQPEEARRELLLRGMPALVSFSDTRYKPRGQVGEGGRLEETGKLWYYAFQGKSFIDHLRRHKALFIPEYQVHTVLHKLLDVEDAVVPTLRDRFRVGERQLRNVWVVPEQLIEDESVPAKKFTPEY